MDGFDSVEPEDLLAQQQTILVYGIVAITLGLISAALLIPCYGCSPISPFPILVGWVCIRRGRENMAGLRRLKMSDNSSSAGVVLGTLGLVLGFMSLVITLVWGVIMGFGMGCFSLLYMNS